MPTILVLAGYFLPGYKGGGPVQSLANLIEAIGDEFLFRVVAKDRDLGESVSYDGICPGQWMKVGRAEVLYLPAGHAGVSQLLRILRGNDYHLLYINSFFGILAAFLPLVARSVRLIPRRPTVVAPRGQFSPGALLIHPWRKRVYLGLVRATGLVRDLTLQATSVEEVVDVHRELGAHIRVAMAPNLSGPQLPVQGDRQPKRAGVLRAVFLSRIARKKNLAALLEQLKGVSGSVSLDVFGPIEDLAYWRECKDKIKELPPNVKVAYRGEVRHENVHRVLSSYDLFILPTLGENYGHVIAEALAVGCPVLTTDRTPWRDLDGANAGWAVSLESSLGMRHVIELCVEMHDEEWQRRSGAARALVRIRAKADAGMERHRELFLGALSALPRAT